LFAPCLHLGDHWTSDNEEFTPSWRGSPHSFFASRSIANSLGRSYTVFGTKDFKKCAPGLLYALGWFSSLAVYVVPGTKNKQFFEPLV